MLKSTIILAAKSFALSFLLFVFALFLSVSAPVKADGFSLGTQITLTDLYDNTLTNPPIEGTKAEWGFSILIEGTEKTILFDTGGGWYGDQGQILIQNINSMGIALDNLDLIVISHDHPDHKGGLNYILEKKSGLLLYLGLELFNQNPTTNGAIPVRVNESVEICKDVYSTGELPGTFNGAPKNEQTLILDTSDGLVVITGCAHSGIINILKKAKEMLNKNIFMVLGGLHLLNSSDADIKQIIQEFKSLGVQKCGATHCTGDNAIALFKEAYGQDYITLGVGKVIQFSANPVIVKEQMELPDAFHLGEAHPNPFNPTTTIEYTILRSARVILQVYNVTGQKVATLAEGMISAGQHSVVWDAHGMPSGVYFYTLRTEQGFTEAKKVLLLK